MGQEAQEVSKYVSSGFMKTVYGGWAGGVRRDDGNWHRCAGNVTVKRGLVENKETTGEKSGFSLRF